MPASFRQGPRRPQKFYVPTYTPAATVTTALAATSVGVGNVTAALSVAHALTSTSTGAGNVTAALSVKHNLATGTVGVGRVTAALSVTHRLATTATGVGSASGALSGVVTTRGGAGPRLQYLYLMNQHPRSLRQPEKSVQKPVLRRQPLIEASITTDDILALWASDALSDSEALAALEEVLA